MLFADSDNYALGALIASICTGVALIIKSISDAMTANAKARADAKVAALLAISTAEAKDAAAKAASKVEEVRHELSGHQQTISQGLAAVAIKVEEVHKATNSLTDRLVESTAKESHAAGMKQQLDRDQEERRRVQGEMTEKDKRG